MLDIGKSVIIVVILGIYYNYQYGYHHHHQNTHSKRTNQRVMNTLVNLQDLYESKSNKKCSNVDGKRVVIGYNACVDLVVNASVLFEELLHAELVSYADFRQRDKDDRQSTPNVASRITTIPQFAADFAQVFTTGVGIEKFCSNESMFERLVKVAHGGDAVSIVGGNAAVMATRFEKNGCDVHLLATHIGEHTASRIPHDSRIRWKSQNSYDDIHLIVEYMRGPLLEGHDTLISPRHNRFILTRDLDPQIPVELLDDAVDNINMGVLVLSGFHLFGGRPGKDRTDQFRKLARSLERVPKDVIVHVEVASIEEVELYKEVATTVLPHVTSIGANEQETMAFDDALQRSTIETSYPQTPIVGDIVKSMLSVMDETNVTRFHMHSISFHAVCESNNADNDFSTMRDSMIESSLTATQQACMEVQLKADDLILMFPSKFEDDNGYVVKFEPTTPFHCWSTEKPRSRRPVSCCVVPVLVCKKPKRTVGLGDHISAAGLSVYV